MSSFDSLWKRRGKFGEPPVEAIEKALQNHDDHGGFATCELREWYSSGRSWDEYLGTTSQKARESEEVPKQAPSERNKLLNHIGGGINANVEIPEHQPLVSIGGPVPAPGPKAFNPMIRVPCPIHGCEYWGTNHEMDDHIRTHLCQSSGEKHLYHMRHHSDLYHDKILPGYRQLQVPRFLVHILNGDGKGVKKHVNQPPELRRKFMRQIGEFFVVPDPGKMKRVPRTEADIIAATRDGFVFTAWHIHPELMAQGWWHAVPLKGALYEEPPETFPFDFNESRVPKPDGWLATFRDLRPGHIRMLEEFREGVYQFVEETTGVCREDLEVWTHTPVSEAYSTFHIKVHYLRPQDERYLGRSILLDDCINNLKRYGDAFGPPAMQDYWGGHQIILTLRRYCVESHDPETDIHNFT